MAAITPETGYFGGVGISDPVYTMNQRVIGREIDFAKSKIEASKYYPVLPISAGFCVTHIAVEQYGAADADVELTFAPKSDDTKASKFTLGATTPCRSCLANDLFVSEADMLCVSGASAVASGKVAVYLIGFDTFGEGVETAPADTEAWRKQLQTTEQAETNVSGGQIDPRTPVA